MQVTSCVVTLGFDDLDLMRKYSLHVPYKIPALSFSNYTSRESNSLIWVLGARDAMEQRFKNAEIPYNSKLRKKNSNAEKCSYSKANDKNI